MSSIRVAGVVLAGLIGGIAVGVLGLIAGAIYGGNYATQFEFNGLRGYEATGQIGLILGCVTGAALCGYLVGRLTRRAS
jgi:hypothetical protein